MFWFLVLFFGAANQPLTVGSLPVSIAGHKRTADLCRCCGHILPAFPHARCVGLDDGGCAVDRLIALFLIMTYCVRH